MVGGLTQTEEELRVVAEGHWVYTESIIERVLDLARTCYIKAFIHGYKHGLEDRDK